MCADPQYFTSVVRLLVPGLVLKEYTEDIDFSQQDTLIKEFEELLQSAQDHGYETFYVSPADFAKCDSQQFLYFIFDLLNPKE